MPTEKWEKGEIERVRRSGKFNLPIHCGKVWGKFKESAEE